VIPCVSLLIFIVSPVCAFHRFRAFRAFRAFSVSELSDAEPIGLCAIEPPSLRPMPRAERRRRTAHGRQLRAAKSSPPIVTPCGLWASPAPAIERPAVEPWSRQSPCRAAGDRTMAVSVSPYASRLHHPPTAYADSGPSAIVIQWQERARSGLPRRFPLNACQASAGKPKAATHAPAKSVAEQTKSTMLREAALGRIVGGGI
jgi:hypothetical protein